MRRKNQKEEMTVADKDSKWASQILTRQHDDGSWGHFRSLSNPTKAQPMTTEQALRRLRILGFTKNVLYLKGTGRLTE
ncbi:MAG: hypothetical protein GX173_03790 [Ruminococcaceae bacterium]|nr:hypothetical protein [Oscillospiraceae bacterium]